MVCPGQHLPSSHTSHASNTLPLTPLREVYRHSKGSRNNKSSRGEHIHHGYWPTEDSKNTETKEQAQLNLINLLLTISSPGTTAPTSTFTLPPGLKVLDVGCGLGGTSRHLASLGASVTGITISTRQVEMATRLSNLNATPNSDSVSSAESSAGQNQDAEGFTPFGPGRVKFLELDAEKMGEADALGADAGGFDVVWISEALSHVPRKEAFFENAFAVLKEGGEAGCCGLV